MSTFFAGKWLQRLDNQRDEQIMIVAESLINDKSALKALKTKLKYNYMVKKRRVLVVGVVLNFLILAVVKYTNFVIANLNTLFSWMNINTKFGFLQIIFPLGISFYTFQSVGYLIDVYRGKIKADHHFFHYALFVSYFPQIIQGPISRYDQLANQLMEPHLFDYQRIKFGIQRMLWGFFKKMVIADRIAVVVNQVFDHFYEKNYGGFVIFIAVLLYGIQIYADFSSGMDIIYGVSQIFGIQLSENFRRPFMARSVAEFWQRWHITLGTWMRDYVFYPLALSKPFNYMGKKMRKWGSRYAAKVIPT